jgi:coenzyme F420-dependent glucose-6-phosphate dehydrogenase
MEGLRTLAIPSLDIPETEPMLIAQTSKPGAALIKLGYKASAEQFAPAALLDFACVAEEVGFDSVFISDHFQPWKHTDGHAPFSLAWLGALGAKTSRIVMGPSVLTPTFRYHPSIVAQAFGTLGSLFPGRVILGVGTGESLNEVPATGNPWPEFKERFARLRESIALIRRLWTEERVTFDGEYYRTRNATIYDRPAVPVPIYVAAAGALVAKYAGRSADGFICTSGKPMELYTETLLPNVAAGLAQASRADSSFDRVIEVKVSFDTDRRRAMEDTRNWAALALTPEEKTSVEDPSEIERLAAALPIERAASRWIVSDDADEHIDKIMTYVALGFRHLVFHAPGADQKRFLQLYSKHVLPKLRTKAAAVPVAGVVAA